MKHMFTLAAGAALTCALGCGGNSATPTSPGQPGAPQTTGASAIVSLRIEGPATLTVGETAQLKVVASLAGGTTADVTARAVFSVSNSAVAAVSASGELRALAPGDCGLTALVDNVSATFAAQIKAKAEVITKLSIRGKSSLEVGEKIQLQVIATLEGGAEIDVTARATFKASNQAVLQVSASGLLEAVGVGACDLEASADGAKDSIKIEVRSNGDGEMSSIQIVGSSDMSVGDRSNVQVIGTHNGGGQSDVTGQSVLTSSNTAVVSVNGGGVIEAVGPGSCDLIATNGGLRATLRVVVRAKGVTVAKLRIDGATSLQVGASAQLKAIATLSDNTEADVTGRVSWSTSSAASLGISVAGLLTAAAPCECVVSALLDGVKASVTVQVKAAVATIVKLRIEGLTNLLLGQTAQLKVIATLSDNTELDVTDKVNWTTSNTALVLVKAGGVLTALGPCECLVTALLDGVKASVTVVVKAAVATIVKLRIEAPAILKLGQTAQLKAIATLSDNTEVDVTGKVSWTTNNPASLLVSVSGILTALLPGDCLITGLVDGVQATATVKVTL